ncbi:hypothetical protein [Blastococcus montanus]|uniref:hypothetical protein n=1 Tax=Blastococcus montanus TaxID=3144973 RepID=UPI0032084530
MSTQKVIFHVGTPKSGTTYLQDLLWHSREALAEAGVRYPGEVPEAHFHATRDLAQNDFNGWPDPAVQGAWSRLVEAARAHEGTTVISHELFGDLPPEAIARALGDLDFAEVHVVVTARDLARQLPAVWQEDVKNRHFVPFDEFLRVVRSDAWSEAWYGRALWLRQDVPAVVRRWAAELPPAQVHLVTVPPRGADPATLWERFAAVVGVDPGLATPPDGRRNKSLGRAEAELLRRLNERLDYGIDWPTYASRITHHVAASVLAERPSSGSLTVPAGDRPWVVARAAAMVAELRATGCQVVGDLAELEVTSEGPAREVPEPSAEELLDAALDALVALIPTHAARAPEEAPEGATEETTEAGTPEDAVLDGDLPGQDALVPTPRDGDPLLAAPAELPGVAAHVAAAPARRLPVHRVDRWLRRLSVARRTGSLTSV